MSVSEYPVSPCKANGLTVAYSEKPVLKHVDFETPSGVITGIVGPNGAGKTTLMQALLGLIPVIHGDVRFFGGTREENRHRIGYMPQQNSVDWDFPSTVLDIVLMGTYGSLGWFKRPGKREVQRAKNALMETGMLDFVDRQIGQLSGGQKQRTFLARTLVQEPDIYFMDEPFQGVDAQSEKAIVKVMHRLKEKGKTIIMVHHDLSTIKEYCDHVTLLRESIIAQGPVEQVLTRENLDLTYGTFSTPIKEGVLQ